MHIIGCIMLDGKTLEVVFYWISGSYGSGGWGWKGSWRSCAATCLGTLQLKTRLENDNIGIMYSSKGCPSMNKVGSFQQWSDRKVYRESDFSAGELNCSESHREPESCLCSTCV